MYIWEKFSINLYLHVALCIFPYSLSSFHVLFHLMRTLMIIITRTAAVLGGGICGVKRRNWCVKQYDKEEEAVVE